MIAVVVRHARRVSGITDLSLNSIDVLTGIETVKICAAYNYNGEVIEEFPASLKVLAECEPVYEELPGWTEDITGCKSLDELPVNARHYVRTCFSINRDSTFYLLCRSRSYTNKCG